MARGDYARGRDDCARTGEVDVSRRGSWFYRRGFDGERARRIEAYEKERAQAAKER